MSCIVMTAHLRDCFEADIGLFVPGDRQANASSSQSLKCWVAVIILSVRDALAAPCAEDSLPFLLHCAERMRSCTCLIAVPPRPWPAHCARHAQIPCSRRRICMTTARLQGILAGFSFGNIWQHQLRRTDEVMINPAPAHKMLSSWEEMHLQRIIIQCAPILGAIAWQLLLHSVQHLHMSLLGF